MSMTKYSNIIKTFDEIAEKTQDVKADRISNWVHMSLEKEHKPAMALVSFNLNHADRLNMIRQFFGIEIPKEVVHMIEGEPVCLILDYSETPVFLNENGIAGNKIIFGIPSEPLRNYRIAICDEIHSRDMWLELSDEIDALCLLVNATMAMSQMERSWIKECAVPFFSGDALIIAVTKMNLLNEDEDVQAVRRVVADSLNRLNVSPKTFENDKEALELLTDLVKKEYVQDNHDRRVIKNGLNVMESCLRYWIDSVVIDTAAIQSTMEQLKKQEKTLELAGQLASGSILVNELNRLKLQMCDGIRDYGRQMADNIKKKIEDSPLVQLETMTDKINAYISGSWDYYMKSMSVKADEEVEAIAQKLTKQMEADAGKMVSDLDESARRTIYSALGLISETVEYVSLIDPLSIVKNRNMLSESSTEAITDQLRRETRNMMLLSIPLFFVNPLISIGNIFASKAYEKYKLDNALTDIRSEMAKQAEQSCFDNTESILRQVEISFEDEIRTGSINIKSAYNGLIHQIEDSLAGLEKSQEEKIALKDYLNNQINVVFPNILANL